ncbi:hypothetical protein [Williamsia sp.]|uniref:PaaI family thioesterase n=1 Tax=Williamsia sp. TaxID=1872085 RepID=UPI002F94951D
MSENLISTSQRAQVGGRPGMVLPGPVSFASDFGLTSYQPSPQRSVVRATLTDKLRDAGGAAGTGVLMTVVDIVASDPALIAASPDWTATQDLSLYAADPITRGPIVADAGLVRAGKKVVVIAVDVYDGCGVTDLRQLVDDIDRGAQGLTRAGSALVVFARIPRAAAVDADMYAPAKTVGTVRERTPIPVDGTVYSRLGMRVIDPGAGVLELDLTPFVVNQIGTIQGGALAVLAESAACAMRPGMVACDMQIHYLSQVRVGPARASGVVVRDAGDHSVVDVRLVDAGTDDSVLALTTVTLRQQSRA